MEKVIVYLDDAAYAQTQLAELLRGNLRREWLLVACAPRMTRHISKWVNQRTRENWRNKWADKLFAQLVPMLHQRGDAVHMLMAQGPLPAYTEELLHRHGPAQVLDTRRPKFDDSHWEHSQAPQTTPTPKPLQAHPV
jgi:hypothetical protein